MIQISVDSDPQLQNPDPHKVTELGNKVFGDHLASEGDVSFIFGTDELLFDLKKEFFDKNEFTDVIAFRLNDYSEKQIEGEIYISLPRAKENATELREPFEKEVARLIIHGSLHLLGYADETEVKKLKMQKIENELLNQVNWQSLFEK